MVLLSAAHVQLALSSGIVLFFTTFLFLSGCVIQTRTLSELRVAIKPVARPAPKTDLYSLPEQFRTDENGQVWFDQWGNRHWGNNAKGGGSNGEKDIEVEVVVALTAEKENDARVGKRTDGKGQKGGKKGWFRGADTTPRVVKKVEKEQAREESAAERRRRIRGDIQQLSQAEAPVYYQRRLW